MNRKEEIITLIKRYWPKRDDYFINAGLRAYIKELREINEKARVQ